MAQFTKGHNPNKKRRTRKLTLSERIEREARNSFLDRKNGYEMPISYYQERINKKN